MDTIDTRVILDAGAASLNRNHPDALVRRSALGSLLVAARYVRSPEAAVLAFRLWSTPEAKTHPPAFIFTIANERATK